MRISATRTCRNLAVIAAMVAATIAAPAAGESETGSYYWRAGLAYMDSLSTRFHDRDCTSEHPPALFGCRAGVDGRPIAARGDFGDGVALEVGAGYRFTASLRGELVLGYRDGLEFDGAANFLNVPGEQPVTADMRSWSLMAKGYYDFPTLKTPGTLEVQPFVGGGVGFSRNRLDDLTYRFPGLGNHRATVVTGDTVDSLAWEVSLGLAVPVGEHASLELDYAFTDLGEVQSAAGPAMILRNSGDIALDIAGTEADLRTRAIRLGWRHHF